MTPAERAAPPGAGGATQLSAVRLALLALFLGGVAVASSGIFIKLSELPPTATVFYRLSLSAPFLWLWLHWERPRASRSRAPADLRDFGELVLAGAVFAANAAAWSWCMKFTSVANGSLIANMSPIYISLGAWIFLRERFSRAFLLGMVFALLGVVALMGGSASLGGEHLKGDLLATLAAIFWGIYLLLLQRLRMRFTTATIMTWTGVAAAAMLLGASLANGERLLPDTAAGWGAVIGLALVAQVAGQSLITYALAQLPASFSAVGLLIQPVYAALGAWAVLGETPSAFQAIGGAVVLIGIVIARRGTR